MVGLASLQVLQHGDEAGQVLHGEGELRTYRTGITAAIGLQPNEADDIVAVNAVMLASKSFAFI